MVTPCISKIKNYFGAKNLILIGFTQLSLATYGLGAVTYITDPRLFMYISVMLRFL